MFSRTSNNGVIAQRGFGLVVAASLLAGGLLPLSAAQAADSPCLGSPDRKINYSTTSKVLYLEGCGQVFTLSDVLAKYPDAGTPDVLDVNAATGTYVLKVPTVVREGATLNVWGGSATSPVNELRLRSEKTAVAYLRTENGSLSFRDTKVTSWDVPLGRVDTDLQPYPDSSGKVIPGRAYVSARSIFDGRETVAPAAACSTEDASQREPYEADMDIANSEMSYLGYSASEAWGVSWKVLSKAATPPPGRDLYAKVDVFGDVTNSDFHHNYYGAYTFGSYCQEWVGNTFTSNTGYGLDPHDDSDRLTITGNTFSDNGNHGLICAEFCDNLIIRGNESLRNKRHGMMLYQEVNDSLVENNTISDNGEAGIALYESYRNRINNNTVSNNATAGLQLTVGASNNSFEGNTVTGTPSSASGSGYAVYTAGKGSDQPLSGDGKPRGNVFTNNTLTGNKSPVLKIGESENTTFTDSRVTGPASATAFEFSLGKDNVVSGTTYSGFATSVSTKGSSGFPASTTVRDGEVSKTVKLSLDGYSTVRLVDTRGYVWQLPESGLSTVVGPVGSALELRSATVGSSETVRTLPFAVTPSTGSVTIKPTTWQATAPFAKAWTESSTSSGTASHLVGELAVGGCYEVKQGGTSIGRYTAGSDGRIRFDYSMGARSFTVGAGTGCGAPIDTTAPVVSASPAGGSYSSAQAVTLSANEVADIFYTTDGTTPTTSSAVYAGPVNIAASTTLKFLGRDTAENVSAVQTEVYTIAVASGDFSDGFESGGFGAWTSVSNLAVQNSVVDQGAFSARATSAAGSTRAAFARKMLPSPTPELYYQLRFNVLSQGANPVYLARVRTAAGGNILGVQVSSSGKLAAYNYTTKLTTTSTTSVSKNVWHTLLIRTSVNGTAGMTEVWLDGSPIAALSRAEDLGTTQIGGIELGESTAGRVFDVGFDEVSAGSGSPAP